MKRIDPSNVKEAAQSACEWLGAIGSERRMIILCHLRSGESSVNDLCEKIGLNQATFFQLVFGFGACLTEASLVVTRPAAGDKMLISGLVSVARS